MDDTGDIVMCVRDFSTGHLHRAGGFASDASPPLQGTQLLLRSVLTLLVDLPGRAGFFLRSHYSMLAHLGFLCNFQEELPQARFIDFPDWLAGFRSIIYFPGFLQDSVVDVAS